MQARDYLGKLHCHAMAELCAEQTLGGVTLRRLFSFVWGWENRREVRNAKGHRMESHRVPEVDWVKSTGISLNATEAPQFTGGSRKLQMLLQAGSSESWLLTAGGAWLGNER